MEYPIKHRSPRPSTPPHVGIIGAGMSGLRCADILIQQGFQVTIIEGRNRVGGRVHQTYLPGTKHLVDIGANWIHGTDHNPILTLAKETDTATHSWGEKVNLFAEHGEYVPVEQVKEYPEVMWAIIVDAFEHSNKDTTSIPAAQSLYDWFEIKVKEYIPETDQDFEKKRKFILQMSERWGAFVGGPIKRQSLKFFWLEECIDGENLFCAGTYQKILALIAAPAVQKASIKLSTKVIKIETAEQTVGRVAVTTEKDEVFHFDEVVVTAPLGWLKQNQDVFSPSLPKRLSSAIRAISYGCLEKVYISFPRAFWLSSSTKVSQNGHLDSKQAVIERDFGGFSQFLHPSYSPLNRQHWSQEVVELGTLPSLCAHPTLLFYIFGDQSRALSADLLRLPASADRHALLSAFFRPYYSRLPHFSATDPDCTPKSSFATEWLADELAGNGSYSNFQIGLEEGDRDIEVMREGLPGKGLWFAGEHTAPFVALGTVTGAYWSGEGVGRRIAAAYDMADKAEDVEFHAVDRVQKTVMTAEQDVNVHGFADLALDK